MLFSWDAGNSSVVGVVLLVAPVQRRFIQISEIVKSMSRNEVLLDKPNESLNSALCKRMARFAQPRFKSYSLQAS